MMQPTRLFRYFSPEASNIFAEQKLWFSAAKDFNDIFEVVPRYDTLLGEQIESDLKRQYAFLPPSIQIDWPTYRRKMAPFTTHLMEEHNETLPEGLQIKFSEHFGIICFCENVDSVLMWGHYTSCHRGFVIEFDPRHSMFSPKEFGKVEYSSTRPFVEAKEYWRILLTKSPEWSYEAEHRLIKPLAELPRGKRRDGREKSFMPLPIDAVKAVYFGCRISPKARDDILNSLHSSSAQHVRRFIMRRHLTDYALVAIPWEQWKPSPRDANADFNALWSALGL